MFAGWYGWEQEWLISQQSRSLAVVIVKVKVYPRLHARNVSAKHDLFDELMSSLVATNIEPRQKKVAAVPAPCVVLATLRRVLTKDSNEELRRLKGRNRL